MSNNITNRGIFQRFKTTFDKTCVIGNCNGWTAEGEYFVETDDKGTHFLDMKVTVSAPHEPMPKL